MAIYSSVPPPSQQSQPTQSSAIEAWTVSALQSLNLTQGQGSTLIIPLDTDVSPEPKASYKARKEPLKRDSQRRREAVLKGKEGSRRRQRWENDHLLHVPNAQPPLPSDWEVHPTHPVHNVPYYLAPLWDAGMRHRAEEAHSAKKRATGSGAEERGRVPAELRIKLKKSKGAKTLLQELEAEIRTFVSEYSAREKELREGDKEVDSEDEEIVFVGRNGKMSDDARAAVEEELEREKMVYDSLEGDKSAGFGRWLVHCVAGYYGLSSRSVTVVRARERRREAYVGIREIRTGRSMGEVSGMVELPRPLWGMV